MDRRNLGQERIKMNIQMITSVLRMIASLLVIFTSVSCSVEHSREGAYAQEIPGQQENEQVAPVVGVESGTTTTTVFDTTVVGPVVGVESGTTTTTTVDFTVTTESTRVLGPAWIDQQRWLNASADNAATLYSDYILNNPNDLSTPMATACWAHHEVERAIARYYTRDAVDNDIVPLIIGALGLTVEEVGTGAQATRTLRELLGGQDSGVSGPVGEVEDNSGSNSNAGPIDISEDDLAITDELLIDFKSNWKNNIEPLDEIGGDGTEWVGMFEEIVRPDIVVAIRARPGLPASVQIFVDALFTAVADFLSGTRTDLLDPNGVSYKLPNWDQFVEEAKYSQDCKRAWLLIE